MDVAQVSTQFFSAAMPAVSVSAGVVGLLLIMSGCALRWRDLCLRVKRHILRKPQYDYRSIFTDYLDRLGEITDRAELYPAILSAACRIVGARGASLIVRDSKDRFQLKAQKGLKPFSFEVEEVEPFLIWLERHRNIVTRQDLLLVRSLAEIKSEGLCYFVQFNAEACVPLFMNDKLYGVVNMGPRGKSGYDGETRDVLRLLAVQFATTIHNANLCAALIRQNQDLKEASKFKAQLLSNLSHELRTPLTSIIGLSEIIAEGHDGAVNEEQLAHLRLIRLSGERLLDAMTAMLDISKLEVNRLALNIQKVNIGRVVHEVAGSVHVNDQTSLDVRLGEDAPGIYGDEDRLRQILKHLLGNAAKFTKRGCICVDAQKCGEMLKVCVKDTGPGIAKDKQKSIFDGFRQADGSATREHEGLGLGLAISKKLVELHGGRMWLASKEGQGSEFYFTLPLKPIGAYGDVTSSAQKQKPSY